MSAPRYMPQVCPVCGCTCTFVINGWWCRGCGWDDITS